MKYLNFEGLQYFYSKLSSSLASQYVSLSNLKTINGQSLIGTGDITIEGGAGGDYLPLSGGTLTGSLYMTGSPQLMLIGLGSLSFKDTENNMLAGIYTFNDHSPINDKSYGIIYCKTDDNSSEGRLSPHNLTLTTDGESISVSPSGIEKNGGSPTEVFATDGSVVDMNTYLPLSGGELTGNLYMVGRNQFQIIGIGGSIFLKDTENNMLAGIETMSDYSPVGGHGAYGSIYCRYSDNSSSSTLSPGGLILTGNSGPVGEANEIYYSYSNITITMPDGTYRFNLQKLIDDGYLIK